MRQARLRLLLITVACGALNAGVGSAQMGYQACSLEWLVADSDVVVRASVAGVERAPVVHEDDGVFRNPEVWKTVTLRVRETLKGEPAGSLTFVERTFAFDQIVEGWKDAGREQLWFLVRDREREGDGDEVAARSRLRPHGGGWSVIRLGPPVPEERGFRALPPPIFTMDLNVLEEPKEILEAARSAVAHAGQRGRTRGHEITLPRAIMQRSGTSGDANSLTVPTDPRLEALAQRLIESPGDFLSKAERPFYRDSLRLEGAKALRHFPNEENIPLLKSLLHDPAFSIHVSPDGTKARVYDVREAAYEALHSWGVVVEKPVLREATSQP